MYDLGAWATGLPGWLWHLATGGWPGLVLVAAVVAALVVVVRVVHRWWWRRAVAGGFWVRITPPRTVDVTRAGAGWRLLVGLARLARRGVHLARPPLALEIVHTGRAMTVGLWLPGWVPLPAVVDEVGRVWPGARIERDRPPTLTGREGWRVAGYRLAASRPDVGPLVDDTRLAGGPARGVATAPDVLAAVLAALGRPGGPAMVQVLVRPATGRRLRELVQAAQAPAKPRASVGVRLGRGVLNLLLGAVRLVLSAVFELITPTRTGPTAGRAGYDYDRYEPARPDPLQREAMRRAAEKLAAGPHVLATIRTGAVRPDRASAAAAARSVAGGFATVARHLRPARMWRAASALGQRRARRGEWLLLTTDELAVLAHLPGDPARYGFATAALHRPHPVQARRVAPERATRSAAGWTAAGWSTPPVAAPEEFGDGGDSWHDSGGGYGGRRDRAESDIYDYRASDDEDGGWPYTEAA
ncbi:hypothetical protein KIF24_10955 [Micromonospora sp. Llam7]|uniref:hypothetical protein n=1 Tax=Micromonospora tarapacensis TaxID=2835305 RepID=UPI001C82BB98|nr:hypothetical protein [Micromonospora tarapacensis]MBX7266498.1 hypothetical protein [Micromonospora tarapacensis]